MLSCMSYYDNEHQQKIKRLESLWSNLDELIVMAREYGIEDIFQDNGAKILQQLVYMNLKALPGREGNDAVSENGIEWEMKSINLSTSATGFSTNHHTTFEIIDKYRKVPWSFAIYYGERLSEIYIMTHEQLKPIFDQWERKLRDEGLAHLNNPKILVSFVRQNGVQVYPINPENPIDPENLELISQQTPRSLF